MKNRKFTMKQAYNTMKPTKKKPAKRTNHKLVGKLLDLKYRINDAFKNRKLHKTLIGDTRIDKQWVMERIEEVRGGGKLTKYDLQEANIIWRKYE